MSTTHWLGRFPIMGIKQARDAAQGFLINPDKALAKAGSQR
jgi:hypothetical protein